MIMLVASFVRSLGGAGNAATSPFSGIGCSLKQWPWVADSVTGSLVNDALTLGRGLYEAASS